MSGWVHMRLDDVAFFKCAVSAEIWNTLLLLLIWGDVGLHDIGHTDSYIEQLRPYSSYLYYHLDTQDTKSVSHGGGHA